VRVVESSHGDAARDVIVEVRGQGSLLLNSAEIGGVTGFKAVGKVSDKTRGPVYAEDWFAGVAWSLIEGRNGGDVIRTLVRSYAWTRGMTTLVPT
jgi:hypothetical protein